jgi:hypothetical protein
VPEAHVRLAVQAAAATNWIASALAVPPVDHKQVRADRATRLGLARQQLESALSHIDAAVE